MKQKNMLILWHWKRIRRSIQKDNTKALFEFLEVANVPNEQERRRMAILDEGNRIPTSIVENIKKVIQHAKTLDPSDQVKAREWLICLHKDSFDQRKFEVLSKALSPLIPDPDKHLRLISFGGGDHFIYYKKLTKTGLLDQFGRFMHGNCRVPTDEGDPWEFRSVLVEGSTLQEPVIAARSFDQVWDYYLFHCKRALYEFQEKLLTRFVATVRIPDGLHSLTEFLQQEKDVLLNEELQAICEGEALSSERLAQVYNSEKINTLYKALVHFFEHQKFEASNINQYLIELRKRMYPLLEAMPESIY